MKTKTLISLSTLLAGLIASNVVFASSKCTPQKQSEFEARQQMGMKNAVQQFVKQGSADEVIKPFTDIAVAEQQLIVWGCYTESDQRLLLRKIRVHNRMDVYPAAFQTMNHLLQQDLGIDLLSPQHMFNTTLYLENKVNRD